MAEKRTTAKVTLVLGETVRDALDAFAKRHSWTRSHAGTILIEQFLLGSGLRPGADPEVELRMLKELNRGLETELRILRAQMDIPDVRESEWVNAPGVSKE